MFTDEDYAGLMLIADAGMAKQAADYGNLPDINPSSFLHDSAIGRGLDKIHPGLGRVGSFAADIGVYAIPFVGNALSAYDAARNYADMFSDLKRGKFLSAAGNLVSGGFNTLWAIPGIGNAGKLVQRGGRALIRAAGRGARGAKTMARAGQTMQRAGGELINQGTKIMARTPQPGFRKTMAGVMGAGAVTTVGDVMYDNAQARAAEKRWNDVNGSGAYQSMYNSAGPSYTSYSFSRRPMNDDFYRRHPPTIGVTSNPRYTATQTGGWGRNSY